MILICKKEIEIKMYTHFFNRLKGFMFKRNINHGLCFNHCNSIHTFFMKEKIDVIMADKNNKILYIYNNFKKNRIILPKRKVYYTYEIPSGFNTYKIGDNLLFKEKVL